MLRVHSYSAFPFQDLSLLFQTKLVLVAKKLNVVAGDCNPTTVLSFFPSLACAAHGAPSRIYVLLLTRAAIRQRLDVWRWFPLRRDARY